MNMQTIEMEKEIIVFVEEPTSFYQYHIKTEFLDVYDFTYTNNLVSYNVCNQSKNAILYGDLIDNETEEVLYHWEEEIEFTGCIYIQIPIAFKTDFVGTVRIGFVNKPELEDEKDNKEEIILQ